MSTMEAHNEAASPQSASDNATDRPLTIALVVDTFGNRGNGTSNRPERTTFRW